MMPPTLTIPTPVPPVEPSALVLRKRIVLAGFMGAGKTTVGRLLAQRLGWQFVDLDDLVEAEAGVAIADLFAQRGEEAMRQLESAALAHALYLRETVLALGGGALESLRNRLLLEQTPGSLVVHLDGPFATLLDRCMLQSFQTPEHIRPLLASPEQALSRYTARRSHYARVAHRTVGTEGQTADAIAQGLLDALRSTPGPEPSRAR